MTQRFPPPGYAEVASSPAPKTLFDCQVGELVLTLGGERYIGAFVDLAGNPDPRRHYAALWLSKAHCESGEPWHVLAAARSHRVAVPPPMTRDVITALRKAA